VLVGLLVGEGVGTLSVVVELEIELEVELAHSSFLRQSAFFPLGLHIELEPSSKQEFPAQQPSLSLVQLPYTAIH
jgi:hypothetical protein